MRQAGCKPGQSKNSRPLAAAENTPEQEIEMSISFQLKDDRVVVSDAMHTYSVRADEIALLWTGSESDLTYREAIAIGKLTVQDDAVDGESHGMHGSLYVMP